MKRVESKQSPSTNEVSHRKDRMSGLYPIGICCCKCESFDLPFFCKNETLLSYLSRLKISSRSKSLVSEVKSKRKSYCNSLLERINNVSTIIAINDDAKE